VSLRAASFNALCIEAFSSSVSFSSGMGFPHGPSYITNRYTHCIRFPRVCIVFIFLNIFSKNYTTYQGVSDYQIDVIFSY
ncbi:MAG: hypothetical protein ACFFF4_17245, partial [Candidatus Thorarchaeota archaeon]